MRHLLTIVILLHGIGSAMAQKTSPDARYVIEYFDALPNESNVKRQGRAEWQDSPTWILIGLRGKEFQGGFVVA